MAGYQARLTSACRAPFDWYAPAVRPRARSVSQARLRGARKRRRAAELRLHASDAPQQIAEDQGAGDRRDRALADSRGHRIGQSRLGIHRLVGKRAQSAACVAAPAVLSTARWALPLRRSTCAIAVLSATVSTTLCAVCAAFSILGPMGVDVESGVVRSIVSSQRDELYRFLPSRRGAPEAALKQCRAQYIRRRRARIPARLLSPQIDASAIRSRPIPA